MKEGRRKGKGGLLPRVQYRLSTVKGVVELENHFAANTVKTGSGKHHKGNLNQRKI